MTATFFLAAASAIFTFRTGEKRPYRRIVAASFFRTPILTSISSAAAAEDGLLQPALELPGEGAQERGLESPEEGLIDAGDAAFRLLGGLEDILGHSLRNNPRLFPGGEQAFGEGLLQAGASILQKGFDLGDDLLRRGLVLGFHRPGGDPFRKIAHLIQGGHRPLEDQPQQRLSGQDILVLPADAHLVRIPEGIADARPLEAIPAA